MSNADNLIKAVKWNDKNWLLQILEQSGGINDLNKFGETALMHACAGGFDDIAKILIEKGADINLQSQEGLSALMLAAENGHLKCSELLLNAGANTELYSLGLRKAIDYARLKNFTEIEKLLSPKKEKIIFEKITSKKKISAEAKIKLNEELIAAIWDNNVEKAYECVKQGANPHELTKDYYPIILATSQGADEIVEMLIAQEVNVNIKDNGGIPAITKACGGCRVNIIKMLLSAGADVDSVTMHTAKIHEHPGVMAAIDKAKFRGGPPTITNLKGDEKKCFQAFIDRDEKLLRKYLENNINTEILCSGGGTMLYYAARKNYISLAKLLIEFKANVNFSSENGWTPLMEASLGDNIKIVELLLANNVNVKPETTEGATALHMACSQGNTEIVKLLLNAGAEKNGVIESGYFAGKTPIQLAKDGGFSEIIELLS